MLRPTERKHFFELLRPPEGYGLNFAIGTTFSLDLTTLLTLPIGFAFLDYDGNEANENQDPLLILESVKQFSNKIAVFCQTGQIHVPAPRQHRILNAYIENSVFQVQAPIIGGVFHPKVWILRFEPLETGPIKYRVICLSRNLTFDKSWDTEVMLDGEVMERSNAFGICRPLSEFIAKLPELAIDNNKPSKKVLKIISAISNELLVTQFELPEGFEKLYFWSLGLETGKKAKSKIFEWPVRAVVSPFLCDGFINRYLKEQTKDAILVSRRESLDAINKETLSTFEKIFTLDDGAAEIEQEEEAEKEIQTELTGLHAKIFIMENGWNASIVTGSANATMAAFTKNVEFMVELVGKKSRCGADLFLANIKGETTFADMLSSYTPQEKPVAENSEKRMLEDKMTEFCRYIAENVRNGKVTLNEDGKTVALSISCKSPFKIDTTVPTTVVCRPITLTNVHEKNVLPNTNIISWDIISIEALTAFIAFKIEMKTANESLTHEFALRISLEGIPEDRFSRITSAILQNKDAFIRLLMLILGNPTEEGPDPGDINIPYSIPGRPADGPNVLNGLLEMLLIAISRDPKRIDRIEELVADLKMTEEGKKLLPESFETIWNPIIEVRKGRNGSKYQ